MFARGPPGPALNALPTAIDCAGDLGTASEPVDNARCGGICGDIGNCIDGDELLTVLLPVVFGFMTLRSVVGVVDGDIIASVLLFASTGGLGAPACRCVTSTR